MKRKRFLAVLTAASLSASMALTAMPVFAGDVVSVEASDATGSFSSATTLGDSFKGALNTAISTVTTHNLSSALKGAALSTALDTLESGTVDVTEGGTTTNYKLSNFNIISHTAPSYKTTADGGKIVMPVLTIKADVNHGAIADGTVTFTIDADTLTKSEKVQAVVAVLNAAGNDGVLDTATYANADNSTSLTTAVNKILTSTKLTNKSVLGTAGTDYKLTVSQGAITAATKSAAGSEVVNVEVKNTLTQTDDATNTYTDPAWDSTAKPQSEDQEYKANASYTATIKKLAVTSEDSEYQTKVANALAGVTFTNEDLKYNDGDAKELKTSDTISSSEAQKITTGVWTKIGKALNSIGIKEEDYKVTLRALKKASHKADGSVQILVDQKRTDDSKDVQYATVTVPITHADDTVAIGDEISAKIVALVKAYVADSKDITPTVEGEAAQKKEITAKLQAAVEKALSDTLDGTDTIASEIDKVEVSIPDGGFIASTASTNGKISKANVTVTFKNDAPKGTALTDPGKGFWAAEGTSKTQTVFEYDNAESNTHADTAPTMAPGEITLYKVSAVSATSLTLPEETPYNTLTDNGEIKVTPSFTPAASNNYVIRWTLSDNSKFKFKASASYDDYDSAKAGTAAKDAGVDALKTAFLANDGIALTFSGKAGDTATLTAELIDSDGLVAAKASTTLKAVKGFSDVQNTHDYAYNAINYLANTRIVYKNGAYESVAVIGGVGNNEFASNNDVTRAQFVTFLYRLAQWDADATHEATQDEASKNTTVTATLPFDNTIVGNASDYRKVTKDKAYPTFTDSDAANKFTDVDANAYYAKAVDWAVANGIANGKTDTTFDPNGKVTRAEAATFLYRYYANGQSYNAADFTDVPTTAYYANAVGWASSNGVTQGKTATTFAPNDTTTRKETAAFIYRATNTAKINK
jgi:hypothetical protein